MQMSSKRNIKKEMNTRSRGSSHGYRKLAELVWTWHGVAECSRYEQRCRRWQPCSVVVECMWLV